MWKLFRKRKRQRRSTSVTKHYVEHKESARQVVLERLQYFNQHYSLEWKRVAIRNQRRCWGSCTSLKNLNFNYKILLLPPHLRDYIIVHELCHLVELNHRQPFWELVGQMIPEYKLCVAELRAIDKGGNSVGHLLTVREAYLSGSIKPSNPA
ncbi:MAG: M48 family metallopeptidase [Candidatus Pacebacteria bacterium]|nr:M48 family metallopeptidase [Candidatus Paceibacterota bacterium]